MASEVASLKLQVQQLRAQLSAAAIHSLGATHGSDDNGDSFGEEKKVSSDKEAKAVHPDIDPVTKAKILGKPPTIRIPFNKPCLFPECGDYIQKAFEAGKLSGDGLNSQMCTDWFAERLGYKHSLLTPSCTAALEMTALLLDLGPGDEVIVPSFTFVSTANAFALRGVTLVFADSEPNHPNMSVEDVLSKITDKTKAIIVVHYAGAPIDVTRLNATGIPVVEDCAHAIGTYDPYTKDYIGKTSCLSAFSFHETKNVGIGEGGLLVVNDERLWEKAQIIREKGTNRTAFRENRAHFYTWYSLGSSYLLSDVDAGVLLGCLEHFDEIQGRRLAIWNQYDRCILPTTLFQKPRTEDRFNAHMYFIKFRDAQTHGEFHKFMEENGIMCASHYRPLDQSPFAKSENGQGTDLPPCKNADEWSKTLIRLPLFYGLSTMNVDKIVKVINFFSSYKDALVR
jgi:dTDP-4-amino-4,6-dideoxygalactose transaminase